VTKKDARLMRKKAWKEPKNGSRRNRISGQRRKGNTLLSTEEGGGTPSPTKKEYVETGRRLCFRARKRPSKKRKKKKTGDSPGKTRSIPIERAVEFTPIPEGSRPSKGTVRLNPQGSAVSWSGDKPGSRPQKNQGEEDGDKRIGQRKKERKKSRPERGDHRKEPAVRASQKRWADPQKEKKEGLPRPVRGTETRPAARKTSRITTREGGERGKKKKTAR